MSPSDPVILAFDTSAAHCAAALLCAGRVVSSRSEEMGRGQAERLMPFLQEVLADQGLGWHDLDAIGVGIGPGNFTGIRISVAAARGLALGLGLPAVGIDGFAARTPETGASGRVWVPAPRGQCYVTGPDGPEMMALEDLADPAPQPGPADLARRMAEIAAVRWRHPEPAPAPLYVRPADAAPARDAPPVLLD